MDLRRHPRRRRDPVVPFRDGRAPRRPVPGRRRGHGPGEGGADRAPAAPGGGRRPRRKPTPQHGRCRRAAGRAPLLGLGGAVGCRSPRWPGGCGPSRGRRRPHRRRRLRAPGHDRPGARAGTDLRRDVWGSGAPCVLQRPHLGIRVPDPCRPRLHGGGQRRRAGDRLPVPDGIAADRCRSPFRRNPSLPFSALQHPLPHPARRPDSYRSRHPHGHRRPSPPLGGVVRRRPPARGRRLPRPVSRR